MRIRVTRSGGFAGITRHREIDTADLDASAAEALQRLAETAMTSRGGDPRMPDAFGYEITIDGKSYVVSGEDPAWRALIEQVGVQ